MEKSTHYPPTVRDDGLRRLTLVRERNQLQAALAATGDERQSQLLLDVLGDVLNELKALCGYTRYEYSDDAS